MKKIKQSDESKRIKHINNIIKIAKKILIDYPEAKKDPTYIVKDYIQQYNMNSKEQIVYSEVLEEVKNIIEGKSTEAQPARVAILENNFKSFRAWESELISAGAIFIQRETDYLSFKINDKYYVINIRFPNSAGEYECYILCLNDVIFEYKDKSKPKCIDTIFNWFFTTILNKQ